MKNLVSLYEMRSHLIKARNDSVWRQEWLQHAEDLRWVNNEISKCLDLVDLTDLYEVLK